MIIDLKGLIDDDLIYTYFSHKVEHAKSATSSLKNFPIKKDAINNATEKKLVFKIIDSCSASVLLTVREM